MRLRVFAAAFTILALTAILSAQATSNSSAAPAATAQASQSGSTSAEDISANDKADSGRKTHVRFGGLTIAGGYAYGPAFYPYYAFAPYGLFPYYAYPFW